MHLCSDAQMPRSVKTAPAVLTYRISCINATDSNCRRAIKPKALKLSTLSANARGDDILNRSRSACDEGTCVNASRELQAQSKPSRCNRDSDFAAPPVLVYRPKGSAGVGKTEGMTAFRLLWKWRGQGMRRKSGKVHPRFPVFLSQKSCNPD